MIELSIKVSNSEHSYVHKICSHSPLFLSQEDAILCKWVKEATDRFRVISPNEDVEEVSVKTKMEW